MKMSEELPIVSVLLLAYNQEQFILEAVQSALSQNYQPLEIIISDDCSSDKTFNIIEAVASAYRGPHRIIINRNKENVGLAANINRAWELSSGEFIVAHAGDDISLPDRTEKLVKRWRDKESPVDLVCSYFEEININSMPTGNIRKNVAFVPDMKKRVAEWRCGATGACASYSRKLFEKYGPLDNRVISEDWVYSFRAWVESGIAVVEEPLVKHRTHDACLGVINRNVKKNRDPKQRRNIRKKGAASQLAIAEEWLKAWQISRKSNDCNIELNLKKLIQIRGYEQRAYEAGKLESIRLAMLLLIHGGGLKATMKILVRNVLQSD